MKSKKETKEITLKLNYFKSKVDKENGTFIGGVAEPKYLEELSIDISDDYNFDIETEEFNKNGMYALEIVGSKRALKEFGKFLINMAMYKTNDEDYHEHIDDIHNSKGDSIANIAIRKNNKT